MMHQFQLTPGTPFPEEGGYVFLSALSRQFPFLHGRADLQIAPVRGARTDRQGWLRTDRASILHIRGLSPEEVSQLSGSWFQIEGNLVGMGPAHFVPVNAAPALVSRLVVFDTPGVLSAEGFLAQLARFAPLGCGMSLGRRRTIEIKGRRFIGYGVRLEGLSPDDSEIVQRSGIGKFTSMGCGVFAPSKEVS